MAAAHAQSLEAELSALDQPLAGAVADAGPAAAEPVETAIGDPEAFARAAKQMLQQVQSMNQRFSEAFTSAVNSSGEGSSGSQNPDALLADAVRSIPLSQAKVLSAFAQRLNGDGGDHAGTRAAAVPNRRP
jgi:hypothetical protein